jgi:hypothetical protein
MSTLLPAVVHNLHSIASSGGEVVTNLAFCWPWPPRIGGDSWCKRHLSPAFAIEGSEVAHNLASILSFGAQVVHDLASNGGDRRSRQREGNEVVHNLASKVSLGAQVVHDLASFGRDRTSSPEEGAKVADDRASIVGKRR